MGNNCIEGIIVKEFNEHYKDKFKNIRNVVNDLNKVNGWETRFKILKKVLKTLPRTEFTLLRGKYRAKILVYYYIANRFSIREVEFFLNNFYTFINGKYTLVDFKDDILDGENMFEDENIYLILELEKLEEENIYNQNLNNFKLKINPEEEITHTERLTSDLDSIKDKNLIFEDDFIINNDDEAIILDENLTEEEIEEFLKDFK